MTYYRLYIAIHLLALAVDLYTLRQTFQDVLSSDEFSGVPCHCRPDHIQDTDYICEVRMRVVSQVMTDGSTGDGVAIC